MILLIEWLLESFAEWLVEAFVEFLFDFDSRKDR